MDLEIAAIVRELKDQKEVYDCIMRYCRGIDRLDRDLLLSAYHADGVDDHGHFVGPVQAFADWVFNLHITHQHRTQHHITSHICEIDGNTAHAESYYIFRSLNKQSPFYTMGTGRYIDRLEKRDGRWGIVARVCLVDIRDEHSAPTGTEGEASYVPPLRDKNDRSYQRPLVVDPGRFTKLRSLTTDQPKPTSATEPRE